MYLQAGEVPDSNPELQIYSLHGATTSTVQYENTYWFIYLVHITCRYRGGFFGVKRHFYTDKHAVFVKNGMFIRMKMYRIL